MGGSGSDGGGGGSSKVVSPEVTKSDHRLLIKVGSVNIPFKEERRLQALEKVLQQEGRLWMRLKERSIGAWTIHVKTEDKGWVGVRPPTLATKPYNPNDLPT